MFSNTIWTMDQTQVKFGNDPKRFFLPRDTKVLHTIKYFSIPNTFPGQCSGIIMNIQSFRFSFLKIIVAFFVDMKKWIFPF